jgi:hypothetical protein
MAFFLLRARNSARPLDLWAATREGDAPLELVYGMSRVSGCGTLPARHASARTLLRSVPRR